MKTLLPLISWRAVGCTSRVLVCSLLLLLPAFGAGCSLLKWGTELPSRTVKMIIPGMDSDSAVDPVDVQEELMRSADIFLASMTTAADKLRRDGAPISQGDLLSQKISYTTTILALVTGPNAMANLLDMIVLVTRSRMVVETYWLPGVYGESARPFFDVCRDAETQLWQIATPLLTTASRKSYARPSKPCTSRIAIRRSSCPFRR